MKAQCPICRTWHDIPQRLTLPAAWRYSRASFGTVFYLRAEEGRTVAEVWRNIDDDGRQAADWHWHFMGLDRCCGQFPGGSAPSKADAQRAAVAAFRDHCRSVDCAVDQATPLRIVQG